MVVFTQLGFISTNIVSSTFYQSMMTFILFCGSIVELYSDYKQGYNVFSDLNPSHLTFWRNFVIGPMSEEVVFRSCIITVLRHSGLSILSCVVSSSLLFGLGIIFTHKLLTRAHTHHGIHKYMTDPNPNFKRILFSTGNPS